MKMKNIRAAVWIMAALSLTVSASGCGRTVGRAGVTGEGVIIVEQPTEAPAESLPEDKCVHVSAAGDNLIHHSLCRKAEELAQNGEKYDFRPLYSNVKYLIESADVAILNLETVISESNEVKGGSDDGMIFNSPPEVADAVIDLGFDVFTMANNHVLDCGEDGLEESINFWNKRAEENNLTVLGAYLSEEDSENIRIREVNGVKIAFLAYTQHLNGMSISDDSQLRVIRTEETDVVERQIRKAAEIADAVIVSAHWGVEDTHEVTDDRIDFASNMINWGADVILGCHTHTAQTMEWITRDDGSKGFVYYSMGNFICAQTDNFNLIGEIPDFDIVVDAVTGEMTLENVGCIPTIIHYESPDFSNFNIYPYSRYSKRLAEAHGLPEAEPRGSFTDFGWDIVNDIIEENIPEEFRILDK